MTRGRTRLTAGVLARAIVALTLVACSSGAASSGTDGQTSDPPGARPAPIELQVYAASSLEKVLRAVKIAYGTVQPGVTLAVSADSSSALATKIEQGAPADVFLSADTRSPRRLVDGGLAAGRVVAFAGNRLTVIVPASNPAGIASAADLGRRGVKVIACAAGVPIRQYTDQWLEKVRDLPAYGADFPARYAANVVSKEDNVGAIVAKIALGEGDAGIVYATDATAAGEVAAIAIPADENVVATYGGVVVRTTVHAEAAAAFLSWLAGAGGQAVLASFGFVPAQ